MAHAPDYRKWLLRDFWSIEEAAELLCGSNPQDLCLTVEEVVRNWSLNRTTCHLKWRSRTTCGAACSLEP